MKAFRIILIISIVIGGLIGIKYIFFPAKSSSKSPSSTATPKIISAPVTVYIANSHAKGNKLFATGTIMANEEAELRSEISGKITFLNIAEGRQVAKGTLLLRVNNNDLLAQLDKVKSQLRLAEENLKRQERLLHIEGTSLQEHDQAAANLSALRADSAYTMAQIKKTEVRAPFAGMLGIRQVSEGSYITPTSIITTISQVNPVKIDFYLPEKYASLLKVGNKIIFTTEEANKTFEATITVKDPKVDVTNRSVRYRAQCANNKGLLMPGSFARIEIPVNESKGTITIPTDAVIPTLKGKKVFIVKNGMAEEREVTTGLRSSNTIQVISGLQKGDSVVVNGNFNLRPGTKVKIAPHDPS